MNQQSNQTNSHQIHNQQLTLFHKSGQESNVEDLLEDQVKFRLSNDSVDTEELLQRVQRQKETEINTIYSENLDTSSKLKIDDSILKYNKMFNQVFKSEYQLVTESQEHNKTQQNHKIPPEQSEKDNKQQPQKNREVKIKKLLLFGAGLIVMIAMISQICTYGIQNYEIVGVNKLQAKLEDMTRERENLRVQLKEQEMINLRLKDDKDQLQSQIHSQKQEIELLRGQIKQASNFILSELKSR